MRTWIETAGLIVLICYAIKYELLKWELDEMRITLRVIAEKFDELGDRAATSDGVISFYHFYMLVRSIRAVVKI